MKYIKIVFFNIVFILFLLFCVNFYIYYSDKKTDDLDIKDICNEYISFMTRDISEIDTKNNLIYNDEFRPVENINNKDLPPIILFGCSFVYGTGLTNTQTFSYQLGKITKRKIFNRAMGGWGVQHMLYQLQSKDFLQYINDNSPDFVPEYIIYLCINNHYFRIFAPVSIFYTPCYSVFYKYDKRTNDFVKKKRTFITDKILLYPIIKGKLAELMIEHCNDKISELFFYYLIACKKEQEKKFPNAKFAIIFYNEGSELTTEYMNKLIKNNFIIITKDDFKIDVEEEKYQLPDIHPNALVWEEITPRIVEKLQIQNLH